MLYGSCQRFGIFANILKSGTLVGKRTLSNLAEFREVLNKASNIVILTGSGVSTESGVPTVRGPGSYWKKYSAEDLVTSEAFHSNPSLVWQFHHYGREIILTKEPNSAHKTIAEYQKNLAKRDRKVWIITQNIDELHQRAGATDVIELHGSLYKTRCLKCGNVEENRDSPICEALAEKEVSKPNAILSDIPQKDLPRCKKDSCGGLLRPHVVWFRERIDPEVLKEAENALELCDLLLVVGTSSVRYPASMFIPQAARRGVPVAEFNLKKTPSFPNFKFHFAGPCGLTIPKVLAT